MKWNINPSLAIYPQVVDEFIKAVISGQYVIGQKLPSVRELAGEASINPNTMQRSLAELERREIVVNKRTTGKFVTEDIQMVENLKKEYANKHTFAFVKTMKDIGFSNEEIKSIVLEQIN